MNDWSGSASQRKPSGYHGDARSRRFFAGCDERGRGRPLRRASGQIQFTLGKHEGKLPSEVPTAYLKWFLSSLRPFPAPEILVEEVLSELQSRPDRDRVGRLMSRKIVPIGHVPCLLVLRGTKCEIRSGTKKWKRHVTTRDCRFLGSTADGKWRTFKAGEWELRVRKHEVQFSSCEASHLMT